MEPSRLDSGLQVDRWDSSVRLDFRPRRYHAAESVWLGDTLLLTHAEAKNAIAVDPLTASLWQLLDGHTSLRVIAEDLARVVGVDPDYAQKCVITLTKIFALEGFLESPRLPKALRPDVYDLPEVQSCRGRKLGLGEGSFIGVELGGGSRLRVGSTDSKITEWIADLLADRVLDAEPAEILSLNAARGSAQTRGHRKRHRLYSHCGSVLGSSFDRGAAASLLARSVQARIERIEGGAWFRCPALIANGQAALVSPDLELALLGASRGLDRAGIRLHDAAYIRYNPRSAAIEISEARWIHPEAPDDASTPAGIYPLATALVPSGDDSPLGRTLLWSRYGMARDAAHLQAAASIAMTAASIEIPAFASRSQATALVLSAFDG